MSWVDYWSWLILASVLVILEIIIPTGYFVWSGIAAFVMAGLLYIFTGLNFLWQILIFAGLTGIFVTAYKIYMIRNPNISSNPLLNRKNQQYIGQTVTLIDAIKNGVGKVKVHDVIWKVCGKDQAKGSNVRIVAIENAAFVVEPITEDGSHTE